MSGRATRLIASGETVPETWDEESRRASVVFPSNEYRGPVVASIRVYTTDEYKEMLKDAGLTLLAFYGQGFTEYTDESTRLIVHAKNRKPHKAHTALRAGCRTAAGFLFGLVSELLKTTHLR